MNRVIRDIIIDVSATTIAAMELGSTLIWVEFPKWELLWFPYTVSFCMSVSVSSMLAPNLSLRPITQAVTTITRKIMRKHIGLLHCMLELWIGLDCLPACIVGPAVSQRAIWS